MKSALFGRKYKPLNFKLETTAFHYFDDQKGQFQTIKSSELDTGEDYFTAKQCRFHIHTSYFNTLISY